MRPFTVAMLSLAALALPTGAGAAEIRTGDTVDIASTETVNDDLYVFARTATIRGAVHGDLVVVASTVDVDAKVDGDVLMGAGTARIAGNVAGSVRGVGGQLELLGTVGRDAAAAAGRLHLTPDAHIGRDLLAGAGNADLRGEITGRVHAAAGQLAIAGPIGGDVMARTDTLKLEHGAKLGGALDYTARTPAIRDPAATVTGAVTYKELPETRPNVALMIVRWFRALIGLFALGLVLVLVWPSWSTRTSAAIREAPWGSLGLGAAVTIGVPIAAVIVLGFGLVFGGWWLGLALLGAYALAIAIAFPMVGLFLGRLLLGGRGDSPAMRIPAVLLGLAVILIFTRIPILGAFIALGTVLFGLGAILLASLPGYRRRMA